MRFAPGYIQAPYFGAIVMLEMRPGCECCDVDLPADSDEAMICSFECTFCRWCVALLAMTGFLDLAHLGGSTSDSFSLHVAFRYSIRGV